MRNRAFTYLIVSAFAVLVAFGSVLIWQRLKPLGDGADTNSFVGGSKRVLQDGNHLVGHDIAEGTYRSVGAEEGCSWVLYSGGFASDRGDGASEWTVVIADHNTLFRTKGCGTWRVAEE